jgi:hypothetical protein
MKHIIAILIKFVFVAIFTFSILGIYNVSLSSIFISAVVITIPAYLLGDLVIYRRYGNIAAVIADFGLYFVLLSFILLFFIDRTNSSFLAAAFTSFFITAVEALYHPFVIDRFFHIRKVTPPMRTNRYSTEFSDEIDIKDPVDKENKE